MGGIHIVTDSTSDIPPALAEEWNIRVIPCYVNFGAESLLDQVELSRPEFYRRLQSDTSHPTTAAPPPGMFARVYRELLETASGIVSIHPPDKLTALRQSALNGWSLVKSKTPFRALDAGQVSMGLGWISVMAARAAAEGANMDAIEDLVANLRSRVRLFAALDTIEFLRRSGRVGWAQGTIGKFLSIRPLIKLSAGVLSSQGYVRTRNRGIQRLIPLIEALGHLESLTVLHSNALNLAEGLKQSLPPLSLREPILTINVTPVLGTHVGPNGLGFVAIPD